jgi:hypothetical protein
MAHDQEVVGSNPGTVYWMDVSNDASYYITEKLKIKLAKWGTPKKYLKKKFSCNMLLPIQSKDFQKVILPTTLSWGEFDYCMLLPMKIGFFKILIKLFFALFRF